MKLKTLQLMNCTICVYHGILIKTPTSEGAWKTIAKELYGKWQYPNCLGTLDGKHIYIQYMSAIQAAPSAITKAASLWCYWLLWMQIIDLFT